MSEMDAVAALAQEISNLSPSLAGHRISQIYARKLPREYRLRHGIYYTPKVIADKMLNDAIREGVDFEKYSAIDTSSGGASFLAPLVRKMFRVDIKSKGKALEDLERRLKGIELDPFGAWLSQFLVDCELISLAPKLRNFPKLVTQGDALQVTQENFDRYDYVVGNPPYGRVLDRSSIPMEFLDVLTGSHNLYHVFIKLAFQLANHRGLVHLITPTSFIGGAYSQKLREWIEETGTALQFDFLERRTGVFESVQQELVISIFRKGGRNKLSRCNTISVQGEELEEHRMPPTQYLNEGSWVLPRHPSDSDAAKIFGQEYYSLESIGYVAHTGHVVPHRHSEQISTKKRKHSYPLIWTEAVTPSGFDPKNSFSNGKPRWMEHKKLAPAPISEPCILVKRTSSKEQKKRIQVAVVPQSFINEYGGFYAENHLNVIVKSQVQRMRIEDLALVLSSEIVNSLFRCINGTVTVSASELSRIPLPCPVKLRESVETLDLTSTSSSIIRRAYGVSDG
ncbi:MAG: Eco57I restriction-modification methylase domain-containing protein [Pseudomonadota bacterium]